MKTKIAVKSAVVDLIGPKGVPYGQVGKIQQPIRAFRHRLDLPTYAIKKLRNQTLKNEVTR